MRKIRILFYKAAIDGKLIDNAIATITGLWPPNWSTPPYSHVEIEFVNRGVCFSSATRGKFTGVRFANADEVLHNPKRWDYAEKTLADDTEKQLYLDCCQLTGLKYDYIGCFFKITPFTSWIQKEARWYCSEVCEFVLWKIGLLDKPYRDSPRAMSRRFYGVKPLVA